MIAASIGILGRFFPLGRHTAASASAAPPVKKDACARCRAESSHGGVRRSKKQRGDGSAALLAIFATARCRAGLCRGKKAQL
jgi:hypothetical protein